MLNIRERRIILNCEKPLLQSSNIKVRRMSEGCFLDKRKVQLPPSLLRLSILVPEEHEERGDEGLIL